MSDLLPCPFCGGTPYFERLGTGRRSCIVECGSCGLRHDSGDEGDMCGNSWNTRAAAPQAEQIKPEAKLVTFDEFVQYGRDHGANIVNGMPWSFTFNGHAVTHENDDLYSIGCPSIQFRRGEVLVATAFGDSRLIQVLQPPATQAGATLTDGVLHDLYCAASSCRYDYNKFKREARAILATAPKAK